MPEFLNVMRNLFTREFDRYVRDFLSRHPEAAVVHIGCGLDTRFERVCSEQPDNGRVEWYDLDLPEVIALRRKHLGDEGGRYRLLACSVLEDAWLNAVSVHSQRPFLFLAETVFVYFTEAQVKSLVLKLRDHFPARSWSSTAGDRSKSGWGTAISPTRCMRDLCNGAAGAARSSKAGAMAHLRRMERSAVQVSTCSTSGASSTSLSRGWTPFVGWPPSFACSSQCASSTSSLER
jgi:O-methyltransferase involved in polyketide biosynthesis